MILLIKSWLNLKSGLIEIFLFVISLITSAIFLRNIDAGYLF
jgi:hypothetical protein